MAGELKRLVDFVKKSSPSIMKELDLARMSLMTGEDVEKITDVDVGDEERVMRFKLAVKKITGKEL